MERICDDHRRNRDFPAEGCEYCKYEADDQERRARNENESRRRLRDRMALSFATILLNIQTRYQESPDGLASAAYEMADAMMVARSAQTDAKEEPKS